MFFLPQDELKRNQAKKIFEVIVKKEGLNFLGWREVPIHPEILGKTAVDCMPCIMQAFIERPKKVEKGLPFDRRLYIVRRDFRAEQRRYLCGIPLKQDDRIQRNVPRRAAQTVL